MSEKTTALSAHVEPQFQSLERTREIAIQTAHKTIVKLSELPALNESGANQLRILTGLVNDAEMLEIRKFLVMQKANKGGTL